VKTPSTSPLSRAPEPETFCALLLESLDDEYEVQVLRGIVQGARDADVRVLCVAGSAIDDPDPDRGARNFAFDLLDRRTVSTVLVLCSAIGSVVGPKALESWLKRFGGLPIYCLGVQVEGYPFMGVDNYAGTRAVVEHLIRVHSARRLAVIRGPQDSAEARDRFRAFEDALSAAGLSSDSRLVLDGDYSKDSGARAVAELLDDRRVPANGLDAIVVGNDYMALGALAELQRRGVRIPEDVRVVGFDDVQSARLSRPQLTTVRQPAEPLARRAVAQLQRVARGSVPPPEVFPTELVVRRSCGCESVEAGIGTSERPSQGLGASLVLRRQRILAELMRAGRGVLGTVGQGWENRLLDSLVRQMEGTQRESATEGLPRESLALAVDQLVRRWDPDAVNGNVLQDLLTALRREVLVCVADDHAARTIVEGAIHEARVVASAAVAAVVESRLRRESELFDRFEHIAHRAMFEGSQKLASEIQKPLLTLGVDACVLAMLDQFGDPKGEATVLFAVGSGQPRSGEKTELWALPRHPVLHRMGRALVLLPICVDGRAAGAAVVAPNRVDGVLLEALRVWFGTMVRVAKLRDPGR
jgi:DNA-binding LacI/PurR family transcriptional regulator